MLDPTIIMYTRDASVFARYIKKQIVHVGCQIILAPNMKYSNTRLNIAIETLFWQQNLIDGMYYAICS